MENLSGNADEKSTATSKKDKKEVERCDMLGLKEKKTTHPVKQAIQLEKINQKVLAKEGKLKDIQTCLN